MGARAWFLWISFFLLLLAATEYVVEQAIRVMWELSKPIPDDAPD